MPLVRIALPERLSDTQAAAIADAVHAALVETIKVPTADRFHIITRHPEAGLVMDGHFPATERSPLAFIIDITLRHGRSDEAKRALYAAVARRIAALGLRPQDVMLVLHENGLADWAFAEGVAIYAPGAA
jgi:phenylpyruvate tautomerase PptA (4-oxalocrotonate tautomerase family)